MENFHLRWLIHFVNLDLRFDAPLLLQKFYWNILSISVLQSLEFRAQACHRKDFASVRRASRATSLPL